MKLQSFALCPRFLNSFCSLSPLVPCLQLQLFILTSLMHGSQHWSSFIPQEKVTYLTLQLLPYSLAEPYTVIFNLPVRQISSNTQSLTQCNLFSDICQHKQPGCRFSPQKRYFVKSNRNSWCFPHFLDIVVEKH